MILYGGDVMNRTQVLFTVFLISVIILVSVPIIEQENKTPPNDPGQTVSPTRAGGDCDMVIITPRAFVNTYETLADFRNTTGVVTHVVATEDVLAGVYFTVQGGNDMEKYKYFIKDAIENWNTSYVLLGGDQAQIPACEAYVFSSSWPFYTDLYYSDVYLGATGAFADWETNNDGKYGVFSDDRSSLDLEPDVKLGRLPSDSVTEAQWMVDKVINYENTACGSDWFKNVTLLVGPTMTTGVVFSEYMVDNYYNTSNGWNHIKLYESDSTEPNFLNPVNHSVGIMSFWGHGGETAWLGEDYINVTEVNQMTNTGKLPIVTMMACNVGNLGHSSDCLAESFLKKQTGGAVAVLAGTQTSNGADKDDRSGAVCNYYHESYALNGAKTIGEMFNGMMDLYITRQSPMSDSLDYKNVVEYIQFGDPATNVGGFSRTTAKVSCDDTDKAGYPGEVLTYNISVENTGAGYANLVMSVGTPAGGPVHGDWVVQFPAEYQLKQGENKTFSLNITCPPDANTGQCVDVKFSVHSSNLVGPRFLNTTVKATVKTVFDTEVTCEYPDKYVSPQGKATYTLKIKNLGNSPFDYLLNITNISPEWNFSFIPSTVNLARNFSTEVDLEMTPGANVTSGLHQHQVRCTVQGHPNRYTELNMNTTIGEEDGFLITCAGPEVNISQGDFTEFNVTITNTGNHPDTVDLTLPTTAQLPGWAIESSLGKVIDLEPFETGYTIIKTTSPALALAGEHGIPIKGVLDSDGSIKNLDLTVVVLPVYGFNVTLDVNSATGVPFEKTGSTVTISNQGNIQDQYELNVTGVPEDWSVTVPASVTVSPYSSDAVELSITINTESPLGGEYILVLCVTSVSTGVADNLTFTVTVTGSLGLELTLDTDRVDVLPGGTATVSLEIVNLGNMEDTYAVSMSDVQYLSADLPGDSQISIPAFDKTTVSVNLTVSEDIVPGTHYLEFQAVSISASTVTDTATLMVNAQQVYSLTLVPSVTELSITAGDSAELAFELTNTGNGKDTFVIIAANQPDGWTTKLDTVTVELGALEVHKGTLNISISSTTEFIMTHNICLLASSQGNESVEQKVNITIIATEALPEVVDDDDDDDSDSGLGGVLMWVAILVVVLLLLAIVIVIVIVLMRKKKEEETPPPVQQEPAQPPVEEETPPQAPSQAAIPPQEPAGGPPEQQSMEQQQVAMEEQPLLEDLPSIEAEQPLSQDPLAEDVAQPEITEEEIPAAEGSPVSEQEPEMLDDVAPSEEEDPFQL